MSYHYCRHPLRDGRNLIAVNNSDAKTLLENWVEERAVKDMDPNIQLRGEITSKLQVLKNGHPGVLTTDVKAKMSDVTTMSVMYSPPQLDTTRKVGSKKELMEKMHFADISKEYKTESDALPPPPDFRSVKTVSYDFDFKPQKNPPTKDHNYRTEQPVTFWSEHKDKIHGLTAVKTRDTVFRRNDAFTKPIWEYWDEPKPYQLEDYPKM